MSKTFKNLLFILGLVLLAAAGYLIYTTNSDSGPILDVASGELVSTVDFDTQELLRLQALLEAIEMDTSLFSDPRFISLVDFRIVLVPEPVGRPNPFVPVR
jgi:hypothetical protein